MAHRGGDCKTACDKKLSIYNFLGAIESARRQFAFRRAIRPKTQESQDA